MYRTSTNTETVTVDRATYDRLTTQAAAWRELGSNLQASDPALALLIESPAVREQLIAEYFAWTQRADQAADADAVSAARTWATTAASHAALTWRRSQPGHLATEAQQRRGGGDYTGGPVDWTSGRPAAADFDQAA